MPRSNTVVARYSSFFAGCDRRHDWNHLKQQCVERWTDEQQRMEAAKTGLIALDALTAARLEELGRGLKDHQHVVLGELKREREVITYAFS